MAETARLNKYKLGSAYAIGAALLLAVQDPFSAAAAKTISVINFVGITQTALILSLPLLLSKASARRDFVRLLGRWGNYPKLGVLFLLGVAGLALYNLGLAHAHPITVSALLNLSPFWAALVALVISKKPIPLSVPVFFGCLAVAFTGALMIAWSQTSQGQRPSFSEFANDLFRHSSAFAIPVPALLALSGTLIGKWFAKYDTLGAVAANFAFSGLLLVPATLLLSYERSELAINGANELPIALLLFGTLMSAAIGRALYQIALHATDNDNGFVTLFFLLMPALAVMIAIPLSQWVAAVHVQINVLFFVGLLLVAAPLLFFCLKSWRADAASAAIEGKAGGGDGDGDDRQSRRRSEALPSS